jgi:hypothetical protein
MTPEEDELCRVARERGPWSRVTEIGDALEAVRLAEPPPPKRTLADVERDIAACDPKTYAGRDLIRDLLNEAAAIEDGAYRVSV